jgi:serine/threonine-protein kinase
MISGYAPYRGENAMDIMLKHVNEPLPPLGDASLRGTPIDLAIRKALSKKPEDRFDDCRSFLSALGGQAAVRLNSPEATNTPSKPPPPPPARNKKTSQTPSGGGRVVTRKREKQVEND